MEDELTVCTCAQPLLTRSKMSSLTSAARGAFCPPRQNPAMSNIPTWRCCARNERTATLVCRLPASCAGSFLGVICDLGQLVNSGIDRLLSEVRACSTLAGDMLSHA